MKRTVNFSRFADNSYFNKTQWISFSEQVRLIKKYTYSSLVLEIGKGTGITQFVSNELLKNNHLCYDIDASLEPDILGNLLDIKEKINEKFDLIVCFQVLEHIDFMHFENIVSDLAKLTNSYVIISLPMVGRIPIYLQGRIIKSIFSFELVIRTKYKYSIDISHYWEIGSSKATSKKNLGDIINKYFKIIEEFRPSGQTYHYFYVLKVR